MPGARRDRLRNQQTLRNREELTHRADALAAFRIGSLPKRRYQRARFMLVFVLVFVFRRGAPAVLAASMVPTAGQQMQTFTAYRKNGEKASNEPRQSDADFSHRTNHRYLVRPRRSDHNPFSLASIACQERA